MEWLDGNRIKVDPPKHPRKITGTRFAAIMGLNKWVTPFEVWCDITKTYKEPFEDTIYTIAGKIIEPKQAEFIREKYFWKDLWTPTDYFGKDYFKTTHGDFFGFDPCLGGMWDYLFMDEEQMPNAVLEMKTTKRAEDWKDDIPEYYALQAALYAYLLGVEKVYMVCTVLDDKAYKCPEDFVCNSGNTFTKTFNLTERYPDIENRIQYARAWWEDHVLSGISPPYDEKKDEKILKALRSNNLNPETDIIALFQEAESLKYKIDRHSEEISDLTDRYKTVTGMLKEYMVSQFKDGDKSAIVEGDSCVWTCTKKSTAKADMKALKADGLYEKYVSVSDSYALTPKKKGEK